MHRGKRKTHTREYLSPDAAPGPTLDNECGNECGCLAATRCHECEDIFCHSCNVTMHLGKRKNHTRVPLSTKKSHQKDKLNLPEEKQIKSISRSPSNQKDKKNTS